MKAGRFAHTCGKIRRDSKSQKMSIVVAGGYVLSGDGHLPSVEILDVGSNEWKTGPELPFSSYDSQMVEDQNGGVVLIGGQSQSIVYLDTLFHLPHGGQDAVWTKMEQKMEAERWFHTAFLVPDNLVDCS